MKMVKIITASSDKIEELTNNFITSELVEKGITEYDIQTSSCYFYAPGPMAHGDVKVTVTIVYNNKSNIRNKLNTYLSNVDDKNSFEVF